MTESVFFGSDDDVESWDNYGEDILSPLPEQATAEDLREARASPILSGQGVLNECEQLREPNEHSAIWEQNATVRDINFAFLKNQARYFCVYSLQPLGIGKTSYALQCLQQLYGEYDYNGELVSLCNDWELINSHIVFKPQSFIKLIGHLIKTKTRIKAIVWEDSGIFLASKDWQKTWAKEISKYFQLARTYCASIIMTTPSPTFLLRDIRRLNMVTIDVQALSKFKSTVSTARKAVSYDHWYLPDLTKPRTKKRATDYFNVMLPDCIFKPYSILRQSYADEQFIKLDEIVKKENLGEVENINYDKLAKIRS